MFKKILLASVLTCMHIGLASAFEASYYSDAFEDGTSANGTTFSQTNHAAAICYEELSQLAYVSTAQTGVVVTLTDRPNCNRHTDRIDLSSSVFSLFAPLSQGLITDISATPLGVKTGKFVKRDISQEEFSDYSVVLSSSIPNTFFAGESLRIRGRVTNSKKQVALFLKNKVTGEKKVSSHLVGTNGQFDILLEIPQISGEYLFKILSISPGEEVSIENFESVLILNESDIKTNSSIPSSQKKTRFSQTQVSDTLPALYLEKNIWGELQLSQGKEIYRTKGQTLFFTGVNLSTGKVSYIFTGYTLATPSSLDRSPASTHYSSGVFLVDKFRTYTRRGNVVIKKSGKLAQFRFTIDKGYSVKPDYYVTLPNGDVREYTINKKFIAANGYLKENTIITGSFPISDRGTYRFEMNQNTGIAYINMPFYTDLTLPVIQQNYLLSEGETYETRILESINTMRQLLGRKVLTIDPDLSKVATLKAKDMYMMGSGSSLIVSHTNSKGNDIRVFAESYGVRRNMLGENVSGSNYTTKATILELQSGLEESPGHRSNMISPNFSRVGIGYYQKGAYSYLVHIFSN